MTDIVVSEFAGIAPKIDATELPASMAAASQNAKTWSKALRPFRKPLPGATMTKTGVTQTIYWYHNAAWLQWTQDVDVAINAVAGDDLDKIIFTGTDCPRITSSDVYNASSPGTFTKPASYKLGLPTPTDTPVASDASVAGNLTGSYQWVFTYVRKWSDNTIHESAPCPVSNQITLAASKGTVTLPNASAPTFADYGITHKRVYRLVVGSTSATYRFVAEVAASATTYTDNTADASLGSAITTSLSLPPPDGMVGIVALSNGIYAGFLGNTLYLSEPYLPHSYPLTQRWGLATTIIAIGAYDNNVVMGTKDYPYVVTVVDPTALVPNKVGDLKPCLSKRSMVSTEFGCLYATADGLYMVGAAGYKLVTRGIHDSDTWAQYFPSTIHGCWFQNRYIGFYQSGTNGDGTYQGGGFILDINEQQSAFIPLGIYAYAARVQSATELLYIALATPASVGVPLTMFTAQWEGLITDLLQHSFTSRKFITPSPENMGAVRIEADYTAGLSQAQRAAITSQNASLAAMNATELSTDIGDTLNSDDIEEYAVDDDVVLLNLQPLNQVSGTISFTLTANGAVVAQKLIDSSDPVVLPSGYLATQWQFEVAGQVSVFKVSVANDADQLMQR